METDTLRALVRDHRRRAVPERDCAAPSPAGPRRGFLGIVALLLAAGLISAAPTIGPVPDLEADEDVQTNVTFEVTSSSVLPVPVAVTAVADDASLVPSNTVSVTTAPGGHPNYLATVTPVLASNAFGNTTIEITANDGSGSAVTNFLLTVTPVNDAPTVLPIAPQVAYEDVLTNITFYVDDVDNDLTNLVLTADSSDTNVVPVGNVVFLPAADTNRVVTILSATNDNGDTTITIDVGDGETNTVVTFPLKVHPVNDAPTVWGPIPPAGTWIPDNVPTNLFAALTVVDVDHGRPNPETNVVTVYLGGGVLFTQTNTPAVATTNLQTYPYYPLANVVPVEQFSTDSFEVVVHDTALTNSLIRDVPVLSISDPPEVTVPVVDPPTIEDFRDWQPFTISLYDPDPGDDQLAVEILPLAGSNVLGRLDPEFPVFTGTVSEVEQFVESVWYRPNSVVGFQTATFRFTVRDAWGFSTSSNMSLTVHGFNDPPQIAGVTRGIQWTTDDPVEPPLTPFETVQIADPNVGQDLTVRILLSTNIGVLSENTYSGSVSAVTAWIRSVTFTPTRQRNRVIGDSTSVALTIEVSDGIDLESNDDTTIAVIAVNGRPVVKRLPPLVAGEPVYIDPYTNILPFSGMWIEDDEISNLTVTVSIDDPAKGNLAVWPNAPTGLVLVALEEDPVGSGIYRFEGTTNEVSDLLVNLEYTVNDAYTFLPNAPGETTFSIEVIDSVLNRGTEELWMLLQASPRCHLVTSTADDEDPNEPGTPRRGTLRRAVRNANNGDVITFALETYEDDPAVIRLKNGPLVLNKNVTLKGPGADLLAISGDADGNGQPDTQIFKVFSWVTMEGLTLAHGIAEAGGAVCVGVTNPIPDEPRLTQIGRLTMRDCAVMHSLATQWGGAIDVNQGSLVMHGCLVLSNATDSAQGRGGGAVSIWTDADDPPCMFVNTTFSGNRQACAGGHGGGAIYAENYTPSTICTVLVTHCTFAENDDASFQGSAIGANVFGMKVILGNSVFADGTGRNLWVQGAGRMESEGGNLSDDGTAVTLMQGGVPKDVTVFDEGMGDRADVSTPMVMPLDGRMRPTEGHALCLDSPARGNAVDTPVATDQHGVIRGAAPVDAGALEYETTERVVLNEIYFSDDEASFLEFYIPRNSTPMRLDGYSVWVNARRRHVFAHGSESLVRPGYGIVLADTDIAPVEPTTNPTEIVTPSGAAPIAAFTNLPALTPNAVVVLTHHGMIDGEKVVISGADTNAYNGTHRITRVDDDRFVIPVAYIGGSAGGTGTSVPALNLGERGSVDLRDPAGQVVLSVTYVGVFADPNAPTSAPSQVLNMVSNSITLAPQFLGHAYVPHSFASPLPLGGVDLGTRGYDRSPGADANHKVFGALNAPPIAIRDAVVIGEDMVTTLAVLYNDLDTDGRDEIFVFDVSRQSGEGGRDPYTNSLLGAGVSVDPPDEPDPGADPPLRGNAVVYDPTDAWALQSLPEGAKAYDSFYYLVTDIGTGLIQGYTTNGAGETVVESVAHRLTNDTEIVISGSSTTNYRGRHIVTVVDEDTFTITNRFIDNPANPGAWVTVDARTPAGVEGKVSVVVLGANDPPSPAGDTVATDEDTIIRIMGDPDLLAVSNYVFDTDDDYPQRPTMVGVNLLANDDDTDLDDDGGTLYVVGVVSNVNAIGGYASAADGAAVVVTSPAHGLADGTVVLISGYGGHASYNGFHEITVEDSDTFSIPVSYVDNDAERGVWTLLTDENRLEADSLYGARVKLEIRANREETSIVYDPQRSAQLDEVAFGETTNDVFYYAAQDSHGAVTLAKVTVNVAGVNDLPVLGNDPGTLSLLDPYLNGRPLSNVVMQLQPLYFLSPASDTPGRLDVQVQIEGDGTTESLLLPDLWATDEDTPLGITAAELLGNDDDVDDSNVLVVSNVAPRSLHGAALSLDGTNVTYDPTVSARLDSLAREELLIDVFEVAVSDSSAGTPGVVTSMVAVFVMGLNDTPRLHDDYVGTPEDDTLVLTPTNGVLANDEEDDVDGLFPDNQLALIPVTNALTAPPATAVVTIVGNSLVYYPTNSDYLNGLAVWQTYTDRFDYVAVDGSAIFANDDVFRVAADGSGFSLDVLANDVNFTGVTGDVRIVDIGEPNRRGVAALAVSGTSTRIVYTPEVNFVGDEVFTYRITDGTPPLSYTDILDLPSLAGALRDATNGVPLLLTEQFSSNTLALLSNYTGRVPEQELHNSLVSELNGILTSELYDAERFADVDLSPFTRRLLAQNPQGDELAHLNRLLLEEAFPTELLKNHTDTALVTARVTIDTLNGDLRANDDAFSVARGESPFLDVLANDNVLPASGHDLAITRIVDAPDAGGSAELSGSGISYTPDPAYAGSYTYPETFSYEISGGGTARAVAVVRIVVFNREGTLDTRDDAFSVLAGSRDNSLDVLANDVLLPGSPGALRVHSVTNLTGNGSVVIGDDDTGIAYTPEAGFVGADTLQYVATDGVGGTGTGTVTVTVGGLVANNDAFALPYSTNDTDWIALDVLANDAILPETVGDTISIVSIDGPTNSALGVMEIAPGGRELRFDRAANQAGANNFSYTIADGSNRRASANVALSVVPAGVGVRANSDHFDVLTDSTANRLPVLDNDLGTPRAIVSIGTGVDGPSHGGTAAVSDDSTTITYTPADGFVGEETFTYTMTDSRDSDTAKVIVRVSAGRLVAAADEYTLYYDMPDAASSTLVADDVLDLPALAARLDQPTNGIDQLLRDGFASNTVTFLADYPGTGPDPVLQQALVDELNAVIQAQAPVFTNAPAVGVTLSDQNARLLTHDLEGDALAHLNRRLLQDAYRVELARPDTVGFVLDVLGNDRVLPDFGQLLSVVGVGNASNAPTMKGSVSIASDGSSLSYTPRIDVGLPYTDRFTYEVSDGTARRSQALVTLRVLQRTDATDLEAKDDMFAVDADSANNVLPVLGNDDIRPATASGWAIADVTDTEFGGITTISGANVRYTPVPGFIGTDRFTYTVTDGLGGTRSASVRVKVGNLSLSEDVFAAVAGQMQDLDILANDGVRHGVASDFHLLDTAGLSSNSSATVVTQVESNDTVVLTNRFVRYTPALVHTGTYPYVEEFIYRVQDDSMGTVTGHVAVTVYPQDSDRDAATVIVTVQGVNDAPTIAQPAGESHILDKPAVDPLYLFAEVFIEEIDEHRQEELTVTVTLDDPGAGLLVNLGAFTHTAQGTYTFVGIGADATAAIRGLVFEPTENRVTVPTTQAVVFTIAVDDSYVPAPATDTKIVNVTAVNDPPSIHAVAATQQVYKGSALRLFAGVTVTEVDDLTLQPLAVIVRLAEPTHGLLTTSAGVVVSTNGVFERTAVTAAEATAALRDLMFVPTTIGRLAAGASETTRITLEVMDGFAPPVSRSTVVRTADGYTGKVLAGDGEVNDLFGSAVAAEGDTVAVGARYRDLIGEHSGAAYVYSGTDDGAGTWSRDAQIVGQDTAEQDVFGWAVALAGDTLAVGARNHRVNGVWSGAVYLFERNMTGSNAWGQVTNVWPVDGGGIFAGETGDDFGASVAIEADTLIIGARGDWQGGIASGSAYVFERDRGGTNTWGVVTNLVPPVASGGDLFGCSVALSGDTLAVGAHLNDTQGEDAGSVFIFERNEGGSNAWGLVQHLVAGDGAPGDEFGYAVAVDGDLLVVGAPGEQDIGIESGAAYVFSRTNTVSNTWVAVSKYRPFDGANGDAFGSDVDVENGFVVVGAPLDDDFGDKSGAVYVYAHDVPGTPPGSLREKINPPDADNLDEFGFSLSLGQATLAVGAPRLDVDLDRIGGAYVYRLQYNNAPIVAAPLADQFGTTNVPFAYTIPDGTFVDADDDGALQLSVDYGDATPPAWLHFDPDTAVLSGTPTTAGTFRVYLSATDLEGESATTAFSIVIATQTAPQPVPNGSLEDWRERSFGLAAVADTLAEATVWGDDADPDGDGIKNILEYLFGTDPLTANPLDRSPVAIRIGEATGDVYVTFLRRKPDATLVYFLEASTDLVTWFPANWLIVGEGVRALDDQLDAVTLHVGTTPYPLTLFFRIGVRQVDPVVP